MTSTPKHTSLREVRAGVLRQPGLVGLALREALATAYDRWLCDIAGELSGRSDVALIAVGGLGRRELSPYSDLDLVLLHADDAGDVLGVADSIWYPVWDSHIGLDHSVRTVNQAMDVARTDVKALLGLLDLRHIAGAQTMSAQLRERVLEFWRANVYKKAPELLEITQHRWSFADDAAFLLEPNLKDSRGGLRDAQTIRALALAQVIDYPATVRESKSGLLDVRGELHRITRTDKDVLHLQDQAPIASALELADTDEVLRLVHRYARSIGRNLDRAWRRVVDQRPAGRISTARRILAAPFGVVAAERSPLAKDVVAQNGEVVLARDAVPATDSSLVLRTARAGAENDLPLAPYTLERLASQSAPLPLPWPTAARDDLVGILGTGRRGLVVLEALDEAGLLRALIPEWDSVRYKAQHNPVHRFTVDRHLTETAAHASELTEQVARPDLLLVGALLHDIGKGVPGGNHSLTGVPIAEGIAARMGFGPLDVATIGAMVRHHLLLPDMATRRDLDDPKTIATVLDAVEGSAELLELLHMLTIADALATGPAAWGEWKATLVRRLVNRTSAAIGGAALPVESSLDARAAQLTAGGQLLVEINQHEVVVVAPDGRGLLSCAAGVLALHSLDVRSAAIRTSNGMAINSFIVEPRFGDLPETVLVRNDLARALDGTLPLAQRIRAKEIAYRTPSGSPDHPPVLVWLDDAATDATVLELRTRDSLGLLYRITVALERTEVDIRSAQVSSLGGAVVDAFYLTDGAAGIITPERRLVIERALLAM